MYIHERDFGMAANEKTPSRKPVLIKKRRRTRREVAIHSTFTYFSSSDKSSYANMSLFLKWASMIWVSKEVVHLSPDSGKSMSLGIEKGVSE